MVQLPDGVELTLSELQEMAARQQQQIESQQQMLVAKEQRVKFLKQQEQQHQQIAAENERLQRLRERVETQEMKLQKLRALRGQVDQQKINNSSLTSELESIRSLFNAKEKELSVAVAKVEQLTMQLEEVRKGRVNGMGVGTPQTAAAIELEKLRRELLFRNKLNEQQNNKLAQQREILNQRTEEMARIDKRIAELQQRLHRKRLLNQQLANQINAATSAKQAQLRANQKNRGRPMTSNIAAVEPYQHTPTDAASQQDRALDDLHTKLNSNTIAEELPEFYPNKNDPKYQTLPYNTKFTAKYGAKAGDQDGGDSPPQQKAGESSPEGPRSKRPEDKAALPNGRSQPSALSPQTVHSIPAYAPSKAHATAVSQGKPSLVLNSMAPHPSAVVESAAPPPQKLTQQPTCNYPNSRHYGALYSSVVPPGRGQYPDNSTVPGPLAPQSAGPHPSQVSSKPPMMVAPPYIPPPSMNTTMKVQCASVSSVSPEKPVSAVQPSSVHQVKGPVQAISSSQVLSGRPSTIYQTSSTRIVPVTPHTLGTTPQGVLREVTERDSQSAKQDYGHSPAAPHLESTENGDAVDAGGMPGTESQSTQRPSLPPKPCIPQKPTPPPRQTHGGIDRVRFAASHETGDPQPSVVVSGGYVRKVSNGAPDPYAKSTVRVDVDATPLGVGESDGAESAVRLEVDVPPQKRPTPNELPIKPRPLTIKKQTGVEPPKLKGSLSTIAAAGCSLPTASKKQCDNGGSTTLTVSNLRPNVENATASPCGNGPNRRIEIPPAFLFPHDEESPPDADVNGSGTVAGPLTPCPGTSCEKVEAAEHLLKFVGPGVASHDNDKFSDAELGNGVISAAFSYANNKLSADREKRRPLVANGGLIDGQHLLDSANNELNAAESTVVTLLGSDGTIDAVFGGGDHVAVENPSSQQRQGPVGGAVEENNNCSDGLVKNREGDSAGHEEGRGDDVIATDSVPPPSSGVTRRAKKGNLKTKNSARNARRVSFDPLALLLDAALEGELELVKKTAQEVPNPSAANDEGITALHNAICAGHYEIVKFLVEFGCDVNAQDSDGWTPLHCAASCNNLPMVKFLVEHGACIFATTLSDHETAAEKCEEDEEGFDGCTEYLYSIQEKLGILNGGVVYALYDYDAHNPDELSYRNGDVIVVLRKGDEFEREWWWSKVKDREGYIPRNLLGLYPRVTPSPDS